jgi:hypothetical protein
MQPEKQQLLLSERECNCYDDDTLIQNIIMAPSKGTYTCM